MKLASASLFAILPVLSLATASDAMTATSPVKITSCVVARQPVSGAGLTGLNRTNGVTVTFVNTTAKEISDVTIAGDYNGLEITDTVKGPFAAGSTTTRSKSYSSTVYAGPDASCHVVHASFADGTAWSMSTMKM